MWCKMQNFLSPPQGLSVLPKPIAAWKWMPLMSQPRPAAEPIRRQCTPLADVSVIRWLPTMMWLFWPTSRSHGGGRGWGGSPDSQMEVLRWWYRTHSTGRFLPRRCPLANYERSRCVNGDEWVRTTRRHDGVGRLTIGYWAKGVRWRTVNVRNKDMQKDGLISLGEWKETPELWGEKHLPFPHLSGNKEFSG